MQQEQLKHYRCRFRRSWNDAWDTTECATLAEAVALKHQLRAQFYQVALQYRDRNFGAWVGE